MGAARYDIPKIEQGAKYEFTVTVRDEADDLIDLTGATFEGQIRLSTSCPDSLLSFSFTILDQVTNMGEVTIYIPDTETAALVFPKVPKGSRATMRAVYDISYSFSVGNKRRLLDGYVLDISAEATK